MEKNKNIELLKAKLKLAYLDLFLCRCQYIHEQSKQAKQEKDRFVDNKEHSLCSVWNVIDLQNCGHCEYDEMNELQDNIEFCANSSLLFEIEKDMEYDKTLTEDKCFERINAIKKELNQCC